MKIGYARVSSQGQDLAVQEQMLQDAGCDVIYSEKRSGTELTSREALSEALRSSRAGDAIVVTRLDRFARSANDLHNLISLLDAKGVGFTCLSQAGVDTTTAVGKLTLGVLAAVAAFETDLRSERQAEGIARAKLLGKYQGRKPSVDYDVIKRMRTQGFSPTEIAKIIGIGRSTVYRALSEYR